LDSGVGLLLNKVKALGLDKNTYIIYTSDNGAVPHVHADFVAFKQQQIVIVFAVLV
jgi:arylsulfatase A-like enzyme